MSELTPGSNWADDVELEDVAVKVSEDAKPAQEVSSKPQEQMSVVERTESVDKPEESPSGVSSPDLPTSSSSTTKEDDSSSAPNASSSETSWETKSHTSEPKSQVSEPSWIAERNARQSSSQNSENTVKAEKKQPKEATPPPTPKPVILQPAPPPSVNPWFKRTENEKPAKSAVAPSVTPRPTAKASPVENSAQKENQAPRPVSRKKSNSGVGAAVVPAASQLSVSGEPQKTAGATGKRTNEVRTNGVQTSKPATDAAATPKAAPTRAVVPIIPTAPPPSVRDEASWPSVDTAQEKERKENAEKDAAEKLAEDPNATPQSRKKPAWNKVPVSYATLYETPNVRARETRAPPGSERGGRGATRGRGAYRGGLNGINGADRDAQPSERREAQGFTPRGRTDAADSQAMPPPPKPARASSASSYSGRNTEARYTEARTERGTRGQNETGSSSPDKAAHASPTVESTSAPAPQSSETVTPQTQSPQEASLVNGERKDEESIPAPIPRRSSTGTQTEENGDALPKDGPTIRKVPSDRKEPKNPDAYTNGTPRGGKGQRGGRGRGGNGTPAHHGHTNGQSVDFAGGSAYGAPASPSGYSRGHQFSYSQSGRGGWSRGNPRSQTIPTEGYPYNPRFSNHYSAAAPPNINTYVPGMYDNYGYPLTAIPYQPHLDQYHLTDMVSMQLEYYFSIDNLLKDMFLRKNMDSQGFVFLDFVAKFNRVKQLTQDKDLLKFVCLKSETIEIRVGNDGKERLRKREGWDQFVLPMDQRDANAQNDGPKSLQRPEQPPHQPMGNAAFRVNINPGMRPDRRPQDGAFAGMNGMAQHFMLPPMQEAAYAELINGEDTRGRHAKSPARAGEFTPSQPFVNGNKDVEPDAFSDEQTSALVVVVKLDGQHVQRRPFHRAASRTFSNGSIDSGAVFGETDKSSDSIQAPSTNGESTTNDDDKPTESSRHVSPSKSRSLAPASNIFWMKNQDTPLSAPPGEGDDEPYPQLRQKALSQRTQAATGACPYDLDVLYKFWAHFLIRNYNARMYSEFTHYAHSDAKERHSFVGLRELVKFYGHALSNTSTIRDVVVKDYVEMVKSEPEGLEGAAFKELKSAWRNGALNLKNRKKVADLVDEGLKARLDDV